ncbi:hypothetical protein KP509_23G070400 [Ceratopteris richardii]|uniref:Protein kinase domain-containing protein n=1 Tax=Ceratopteris richardii TaxID=49495 RepID=A0A8T2S0X9_CERRI|nr:hypothetical protein KP509_23G070400 [Ceratopteris richardii]
MLVMDPNDRNLYRSIFKSMYVPYTDFSCPSQPRLRLQCSLCSMMRYPVFQEVLFAFFTIFLLQLCHACPDVCGNTVISYPFGLGKCGLETFRLKCDHNSQLRLSLNRVEFQVLSISSRKIAINPMKNSTCGDSNVDYFSFIGESSYAIPKTHYTISRHNALMMYKCKETSNCSCDIEPGLDVVYRMEKVYGCPTRYCCGLLLEQSLRSLTKNCSSFVSWILTPAPPLSISTLQIQVQYGLELDAWVPGPCSCCVSAKCIPNPYGLGHQCQCQEGFVGDGFSNGSGCRSNASSCRNKPFLGCRRNVVLFSAGLTAATVITITSILCIIFFYCKSRGIWDAQSRKEIKQIKGLLFNHNVTKIFAYKDLEKATKGFSGHYRLGEGAFGTVYVGKLSNGMLVAVKRINYRYMQGIQQVVNEVKVLTTVKHPNLVQLLGCCLEYGDPLLVYEYVPNGTLAEHLQGKRGTHLSWSCRISIATETAQALTYLHSLDPPIYHRDVKSSNILLDFNFTAKVADFGLSRLVLTENSHVSTIPQGTPGYMDPQYQQEFHLSEKSDVYSFGVVLVEIITAMKAVDLTREKSEVNLANLALARIANGTLDDVIDQSLDAGKNPQIRAMIQVVAEIAYRCLSYDKDARPTIMEVFQELEFVRSETKKLKAQRVSMEKSRSQPRNPRRESSARIQSVSCSSGEICGSQESSFRIFQ